MLKSQSDLQPAPGPKRDIFLSHRSTDKEIVRKLAADIEAQTFKGRSLSVWLDEAEIRPGQSVPAMINQGLENSRFIALVMTPAYFRSESGWTDAEWHAALHVDPDNRRGHLIPLLASVATIGFPLKPNSNEKRWSNFRLFFVVYGCRYPC